MKESIPKSWASTPGAFREEIEADTEERETGPETGHQGGGSQLPAGNPSPSRKTRDPTAWKSRRIRKKDAPPGESHLRQSETTEEGPSDLRAFQRGRPGS